MLAKGELFVGALRGGTMHPPSYLGTPIPLEYVIVIKVLDLNELVIE